MIANLGKTDQIQQEFVCNTGDVTETEVSSVMVTTIKDLAGNEFKAHHGDKMTCIETGKEYLFDEVAGKWKRPKE